MNAANLSDNAKNVLNLIARGLHSRREIAEKMDVSVNTVNGSITALKRNGLVEVDDEGTLATTPDADPYIDKRGGRGSRGPREGTKMAQARELFQKHMAEGRQVVLEKFREVVGLTQAGAATYFQTLRGEAEASGVAFQRGVPVEPPQRKSRATAKRRGH